MGHMDILLFLSPKKGASGVSSSLDVHRFYT